MTQENDPGCSESQAEIAYVIPQETGLFFRGKKIFLEHDGDVGAFAKLMSRIRKSTSDLSSSADVSEFYYSEDVNDFKSPEEALDDYVKALKLYVDTYGESPLEKRENMANET